MKIAEYTIKEMRELLDSMSGMYDIARVVDPTECRILNIHSDDRFTLDEKCYGVWQSEHRCNNCSSAAACRTGCNQDKKERFDDKTFHIHSNPVKLKLADGGRYDAVVELVSILDDQESRDESGINDRESENSGANAIRFQSHYDSLTKLVRSDVFYEKAREVLSERCEEPWVMIIGDIREFRLVNSLFGMEKGNEVLMRTAEYLLKISDDSGGLCSRLHADQFAMLLPENSYYEADFAKTAEAMNAAFGSDIYNLIIHFGVYGIADTSIPVSVMCDRANMAVRTIKNDLHRKVAYFNDEIMNSSIAEHEIISGFGTALEEGQIKMYLQPLTDRNGVLFGAEALARWVRPDGSVMPPASFIDTLERAGLIYELDKYIWEQAARQLSMWKGTDKDHLSISVNMSAKDFYHIDVYETLKALTDKYDIECSRIRLEITETALIENPQSSDEAVRKLQDAGFIVEIDDFGKGQSSLSLLKDIRADVLKIDRGFLLETENVSRSKIILQAVIGMAGELGMRVITEGVETERQLKALTAMGCDGFQGYYFSKPLSVEEFEERY